MSRRPPTPKNVIHHRIANRVDGVVVAIRYLWGHSRASVTLDQYAHAIPANDKAAADLMGEILNKKAPETPVFQIGKGA